MKQVFILLIATVVVFVAPGVQGTGNVTRTGCGTSKLCVETPENCDPATNNSCLFISGRSSTPVFTITTMQSIELSEANSTGDRYIGMALSGNPSEGTSVLYICGRNGTTNATSGTFFFLIVQRNNTNGSLTVINGNVTGIQNFTSATRIQCMFTFPLANPFTPRAAILAGNVVVQLGSGTVNGSILGNFTANVTTPVLFLIDLTALLTNTNTNTNISSVNITRTGCGTTKLCVETPDDCDPATNNSCLFTSVDGTAGVAPNGTTLSFELSGATSTGDCYIGVALTANASEGTSVLYVCGRIGTTNGTNGTFFFLTAQRNNTNGLLTVINGNATLLQNLTSDTKIQCVFNVTGVNATVTRGRATDTTFVLQLGSGTITQSTLGNFTTNVTTAALNLINPASNLNTKSSLNITRTGCGTTKLCIETPDDCDPATNNSCLFTSVDGTAGVAPNGTTLRFELSGANRTGDRYIGVALTASASEGTSMLYVCGRNGTTNGTNGTFFFLTVQRNNINGSLTVMNGTVTGLQNLTSDTKIQCVFNITGVNATATRGRAAETTFVLQLWSGTVNGSTLGNFTANVTTAALNLLDPASNLNNTTTAPPTSGANSALFPQAVLLLLSIFVSILRTA